MGRTYEALSNTRVKRERDVPADEGIPPTAVLPVAEPIVASAQADSNAEMADSTADTALASDLSRDNPFVPFVEVGGPKGSKPIFGPLVIDTPLPSPQPLRLSPLPAPAPLQEVTPPMTPVTFFPLLERAPVDPRRVAPELVAFHAPEHSLSSQYRAVVAGLSSQHPGVGCPLLVFTTIGRAVEAATVILNLAITRARDENKKLLVIEADHERPLIASRLGIDSRPGLRELLNRSIPMNIALQATAQPHLYALPPGDPDLPVPHEAESRLPEVLDQLRMRFDWLLVNGPEWGSGGSAEWAALGDAAYFVVRHDQWDTFETEAAFDAIRQAGGKLRGYVTLGDRPGNPPSPLRNR